MNWKKIQTVVPAIAVLLWVGTSCSNPVSDMEAEQVGESRSVSINTRAGAAEKCTDRCDSRNSKPLDHL